MDHQTIMAALLHDVLEDSNVDKAGLAKRFGKTVAEIVDGRVICPLHSWVFDATTGHCPRETHEPVRAWPVRQRDGVVEVQKP